MPIYHIKVASLKNIDICPSYELKPAKFGACTHIGAYCLGPLLSHFFHEFEKERYPRTQETSSYM